jgi:hypothetical protein
MGTTARIRCDSCKLDTDIEIKDVEVDEVSLHVSLDFTCDHCGTKRRYDRMPLAQAAGLLVPVSEVQEMSQLTGLSVERLKSYIYPPDVMKQADLERRRIASEAIKKELKAARQPYPSEVEGWWRVYRLTPRELDVWYNATTHQYRLDFSRRQPHVAGDVISFGEELAKL